MIDIEEENEGIAGATSRLSDEESGHFSLQKMDKLIRQGYKLPVMSILRAILCIVFPPLAVIDKGCGAILLVTVLTVCGWLPGVIGAMVICTRS